MAQPNYQSETRVLRKIATDPQCRWWWTEHAERRMHPTDRDISSDDVKHVLTNGHVVLSETNKKDILWRVQGRDIDGRRIEVVVAVYEQDIVIKIVTVF